MEGRGCGKKLRQGRYIDQGENITTSRRVERFRSEKVEEGEEGERKRGRKEEEKANKKHRTEQNDFVKTPNSPKLRRIMIQGCVRCAEAREVERWILPCCFPQPKNPGQEFQPKKECGQKRREKRVTSS